MNNSILFLVLFCALILANCADINGQEIADEGELIPAASAQAECTENNSSEECQLKLIDLDYKLPQETCVSYDVVVKLESDFNAPAGIKEGSTSKVSWGFLPDGNAGFWIEPIDQEQMSRSGTLEVYGCFSYGSQDTLRISHSITDENGNKSNALTLDIPRSAAKTKAASSVSDLMILSTRKVR